jgi:hypothetical protein
MTAAEIKTDFLQWSGGFEPDSAEQITVYVDYARHIETDEEYVRRVLTGWIEEQATPRSEKETSRE